MIGISRRKIYYIVSLIILMVVPLLTTNVSGQSCGTEWALVNYQRGNPLRAITNNGTKFVAVGDEGVLWTSADGKTWTHRNPNPTNTYDVVYGGSMFVTCGYKGFVATSANGISWTQQKTPALVGLWGVAYGGGVYVVVGNKGTLLRSTNGTTWTAHNWGSTINFLDVVYAENKFYAVGASGTILVSDDGASWTKVVSVGINLACINYGNGVWLAGGREGAIFRSIDGVNWTKRATPTTVVVQDIIYTGSNYVAAGAYGLLLTSPDGKTWTSRVSKCPTTINGLDHKDGTIVGVGLAGQINVSLCDPGSAADEIVVASPNGEEEWDGGGNVDLRWGTFGNVGNVKLDYTTDDGKTWTTIVDSTANDGVYSWPLANVSSTASRIRVTQVSGGTPSDESNLNFTIIGSSGGGTLTVTAPNGGETLTPGNDYNIRWTSSGVTDTIRIRYSTDGGKNYVRIADNLPNTGSWTWNVPNVTSSQCMVRINAINTDGTPNDESDAVFGIGTSATPASLTVTSPNGGEFLSIGSNHSIRWTSESVTDLIRIRYSTDGGANWIKIADNLQDSGSWTWTIPNVTSSQCLVRINAINTDGTPYDVSDAVFNIAGEVTGTVTVNSPNGGEAWLKGSTQGITWTTTGEVGDLKLEYSTNGGSSWSTIDSSTPNDGYYPWRLPNTESDNCLVRVSDVGNPAMSDESNGTFSISGVPEIVLNKSTFSYGYVIGGVIPQSQELMISSTGAQLNWSAAVEAGWVVLSQTSGLGNALVDVSVDPSVLPVGSHSTTLTISDPNALEPEVQVEVKVNIIQSYQDQPPFGDMALPEDGQTGVSGSIAVSGWALDDVELSGVKIYREVGGGLSYIGDASFVEGARPDVEAAYPNYPNNSRAGWGYMMLTNFLPEGELKLVAVARDVTGYETILGTRTIYLDHTNADIPFGAIDTPMQGGSAAGTTYRNEGWALTPNPDKIPEDGSTINVFINGNFVGKAYYGLYRKDIADYFPGLANTNGAKAYFDFDTTAYSNGVHTIEWSVTDSGKDNGGIGSRFFTIANVGTRAAAKTAAVQSGPEGVQAVRRAARPHISLIPGHNSTPVMVKTGYDLNSPATEIVPDESGDIQINMKEVGRIQVQLAGHEGTGSLERRYAGYLMMGDQLRSLPIGSTLDRKTGVFSWQPGPGFAGTFSFVFVVEEMGAYAKKNVVVTVGAIDKEPALHGSKDKFNTISDKIQ
jgi:hypothetical protein